LKRLFYIKAFMAKGSQGLETGPVSGLQRTASLIGARLHRVFIPAVIEGPEVCRAIPIQRNRLAQERRPEGTTLQVEYAFQDFKKNRNL
jgi:hypothetical protein